MVIRSTAAVSSVVVSPCGLWRVMFEVRGNFLGNSSVDTGLVLRFKKNVTLNRRECTSSVTCIVACILLHHYSHLKTSRIKSKIHLLLTCYDSLIFHLFKAKLLKSV